MMGIYFHWSRKCGENTDKGIREQRVSAEEGTILMQYCHTGGKDCVKLCRLNFPCLFSQINPPPPLNYGFARVFSFFFRKEWLPHPCKHSACSRVDCYTDIFKRNGPKT